MKILERRFILVQNLIPNPLNTRGPVFRPDAETMRDSLLAGGQQTDLKVRMPAPGEIAQYGPDARIILGGHIRREGAVLAGLEGLWALELELQPGEEDLIILGDNLLTDIGWWKLDLGLERRLKSEPKISQRQLAAQLGYSHTKIQNAVNALEYLSPAAREAVERNLAPSDPNVVSPQGASGKPLATPKAPYRITEAILLILSGLKNTPLVERALNVVLGLRLTEQKTKKLVDWVKKGGQPEDFGAKAPKDAPDDPLAAAWATLDPHLKVKYKGEEAYEVRITLQGQNLAWETASAASRSLRAHQLKAGIKPSPQAIHKAIVDTGISTDPTHLPPGPIQAATQLPPLKEGEKKGVLAGGVAPGNPGLFGWLVKGILWSEVKSAARRVFYRFFPRQPRWVHALVAKFQKLEPKNQLWAAFLTAGIVLCLGSFLIHQVGRLISHLSHGPQAGGQALVVPTSGLRSQTEAQGLNAPISQKQEIGDLGAEVNVGTKEGSAGTPTVSTAYNPPQQAKPATVYVAVPTSAPPQQAQGPASIPNGILKAKIVPTLQPTRAVSGPVTVTQAKPQPQSSSLGNPLINPAGQKPASPAKPQGESQVDKALDNAAAQGVSTVTGETIKKLLPF